MKKITIKFGQKQKFTMEGGSYIGFPVSFLDKKTWVREGFTEKELKHVVLQEISSGREDREVLDFLEVQYERAYYEYICPWSGDLKKAFNTVNQNGDIIYPTILHFEVEVTQ